MDETRPIILDPIKDDKSNTGLIFGNFAFIILLLVAIPLNTAACRLYFNKWIKFALEIDRESNDI